MTNLTHAASATTSGVPSGTGTVVAISGADNTGKTTQLRVLARRIAPMAQLTEPLHAHDPRWAAILDTGMASWWFEKAAVEEVTDVLASSFLNRARRPQDVALRLVDRGIPMLEASLAATVAVREELDLARAAERVSQLLAPYAADLRRAEAAERGVVLLHDADPAAAAARSLAREPAAGYRYAAYQRHLNMQIHQMADGGRFGATVITGDRPIIAIQAELRQHLSGICPSVPSCQLAMVCVAAFGGMSESGKSTAAEYLRTHHGFARLKIGYLIEEAAARVGIRDAYRESAVTQAEMLADSLDRYCAAHHFLNRVSLESVHRDEPAAELRKLLGGNLTLIYLDTPAQVREQRGVAGAGDVSGRDAVKHQRGAAAVAALADRVISNGDTRLALARQLDLFATGLGRPRHPLRAAPVDSLGLPVHLESYLAKLVTAAEAVVGVDLLAITGSGARGKYQHGWSDLDLLFIADTTCLRTLRRVLAEATADLNGVKLGVTLITRAECTAGAVTPRLLHVLRTLSSGEIAPLWCRPGLALVPPEPWTDATESLRDGIQAAVEIRRQLLHPTPDVRALYKITALLAKVMLRFEGTDCPADDEAIRVLLKLHGVTSVRLALARCDGEAAKELALAVLDTWLGELPSPLEAR
ncbi:MAG: nucleotidyltransferase domain-containing protein [bacterium]|nr:nucleotidyltransferase domain-containing protein [bacterium]